MSTRRSQSAANEADGTAAATATTTEVDSVTGEEIVYAPAALVQQQQSSSAATDGPVAVSVEKSLGTAETKARRRRRRCRNKLTLRPSRLRSRRTGGDKKKGAASSGANGDLAPPSLRRQLSPASALLKYEHRLLGLSDATFAVLHNKWISIYDKSIRLDYSEGEGVFSIDWTAVLQRVAASKGAQLKGVLPHYHRRVQQGPPIFEVRPDIVEQSLRAQYKGVVIPDRVFVPQATVTTPEFVVAPNGENVDAAVFAFTSADRRNDKAWHELHARLNGPQSAAATVATGAVDASGAAVAAADDTPAAVVAAQ